MAPAGRQTQAWDSKTHEDILISLFQHVKLTTPDLQKVMGDLQAKGYTFTESALRYGPQLFSHASQSCFALVCFVWFTSSPPALPFTCSSPASWGSTLFSSSHLHHITTNLGIFHRVDSLIRPTFILFLSFFIPSISRSAFASRVLFHPSHQSWSHLLVAGLRALMRLCCFASLRRPSLKAITRRH
jgi:hypothetical protein